MHNNNYGGYNSSNSSSNMNQYGHNPQHNPDNNRPGANPNQGGLNEFGDMNNALGAIGTGPGPGPGGAHGQNAYGYPATGNPGFAAAPGAPPSRAPGPGPIGRPPGGVIGQPPTSAGMGAPGAIGQPPSSGGPPGLGYRPPGYIDDSPMHGRYPNTDPNSPYHNRGADNAPASGVPPGVYDQNIYHHGHNYPTHPGPGTIGQGPYPPRPNPIYPGGHMRGGPRHPGPDMAGRPGPAYPGHDDVPGAISPNDPNRSPSIGTSGIPGFPPGSESIGESGSRPASDGTSSVGPPSISASSTRATGGRSAPRLPPRPETSPPEPTEGGDVSSFRAPLRPGVGKQGKTIMLKANFFRVEMPSADIFHYEVEIKPDKCPRRVNREIVREMVHTYQENIFSNIKPVFDGRKNLYTTYALSIDRQGVPLDVKLPSDGRERQFQCHVKFKGERANQI